MQIAVIGSGISGLASAWLLSRAHDVTLYESEPRLGGHAHTHEVELDGRLWVLDTGFLVHNERTYPNFIRLLGQLGVERQPSDMSFSVRCRRCGLEWASRNLRTVFAQPRRLADVGHLRMLVDVVRFFRAAREFLAGPRGYDVTMGQWLGERQYGGAFARHFLLPMVGAIWSAPYAEMREFPARSLLTFLDHHGLLASSGAPRWYTVKGGSRTYVEALARSLSGRIRLGCPVTRVSRDDKGAALLLGSGEEVRVDKVVFATHADTALGLLADPSPDETHLLGSFRYSTNRTVLHTDRSALPDSPAAWASWNADIGDCHDEQAPVSVTYHLNRLQSIGDGPEFCVSLNGANPPKGGALAEMIYTHPILDRRAVDAQPGVARLSGVRHTFYCGAHLGWGFHEDGLVSALAVAGRFGISL